LSWFLKGILPAHHGFQGGEMVKLFKYANSAEFKKHMYLSKEKSLYLKLEHLAHCFPVRIELVFEWTTACPSGSPRGRNAQFVPNMPRQLSG
jgi:hypothetical protein